MCRKRKEISKSLCSGGTGAICLCVSGLWMVVLLITLVFHLNHERNQISNKDSTSTESVRESVDFTITPCVFQDGITVQIPHVNIQLVSVAKSSKDSNNFQASMLQITKKLVHSFKVANISAEKIDSLSRKIDSQLNYIYSSLELYENSNHLFKFIEQPLKNVTKSTKKIAHYFLSTARKFDQLFHLMKVFVNGSIGKKLIDLERALNTVEGQMKSSMHTKRELKKAIESVTNSSIDSALRLQQDQDELEMATLEWKSLQSRSNSANCFESWEWNWWPLTYTTTSVCFGRPSDEDWTNSKKRLENAKWKSSCSTQESNDIQEKMKMWIKVDEDLSNATERLAKNKNDLQTKMAMFNGTSSESLVQMERDACKMTTGFTTLYSEAAAFFLDISSRFSDNLAILEPTTLNNANGSRPMPSDAFLELRSNLKKTTNEALDQGTAYANIPKIIFRHDSVFRFQMEQLEQMKIQKLINSDNLGKILMNIRKSHLDLKSADQYSQACDALHLSVK